MNVDVVFTAKEVDEELVKGKTAIVIDILRATTVMVNAIENGIEKIIPVLTPEEAFDIRSELGENKVILGGERLAMPIEGFDFGNSPLDYAPEVVKNKALVITTTNGTRAIKGAVACDEMLIACFRNAQAIIDRVKKEQDVVIICSGSKNLFTMEDSLCGGLLASRFSLLPNTSLTDSAIAMKELYEVNKDRLQEFCSSGRHYRLLKGKGFYDDLDFCFEIDTTDIIPLYKKGDLIKS